MTPRGELLAAVAVHDYLSTACVHDPTRCPPLPDPEETK